MLILFIRAEEKEKYPVMEVKMFKETLSYTFSNLAALLNYGATYAIDVYKRQPDIHAGRNRRAGTHTFYDQPSLSLIHI